MHIIIIRNFKRKLTIFSLMLVFWIFAYIGSSILINNSLILNVTINNFLRFSYPFSFEVENIYVNKNIDKNVIETNFLIKRPFTQKLLNFKSDEGKFSFSYPSIFTLSQQHFSGSDILYHIDFMDKASGSHGFVQVWNMPYSLKDFLDKSKETSSSSFKNFSSNQLVVDGQQGYYWDYEVSGNNSESFKGSEVFFKKDNLMYRISYFVPGSKWDKKQSDIFWKIVDSFRTY